MFENCIGNTEIAFAVFKIDGIDFVRHGARPDLSGFDFLFEIFHRDVLPEIAVEVYQDGIDAAQSVEDRRQIIVI